MLTSRYFCMIWSRLAACTVTLLNSVLVRGNINHFFVLISENNEIDLVFQTIPYEKDRQFDYVAADVLAMQATPIGPLAICRHIISLPRGSFDANLRRVILKLISGIDSCVISCEIAII